MNIFYEQSCLFNCGEQASSVEMPEANIEQAVLEIVLNTGGNLVGCFSGDVTKDLEIIRFDAQKNDQYIWVLKGGDTGTYMLYAGMNSRDVSWADFANDTRFFHISFVSNETGFVREVSVTGAIEVLDEYREQVGRVQRRFSHLEQLQKILPGVDVAGYLTSNFRYDAGEEMALRVSIKNSRLGHLQLVRTKLTKQLDDFNFESTVKRQFLMAFEPSLELVLKLSKDGEIDSPCYKLKNTHDFYCTVEPLTERKFNNALKKTSVKDPANPHYA